VVLNLDTTNILKLITNNSIQYAQSIGYNGKYIEVLENTKLLGLQIDNHLNWTNLIDYMIPKLRETCYAAESMLHASNTDMLKSIHFA
jgi:hypothetical protein